MRDTHLLRSVIKLCKLGRLDKPLRTHFNPYVNNAMKMHWTDQKLKRRMTKEEESTATCIPRRSLVQDWLYYINIRLTVYRKPELAQRPCKSSLYRSNFSICTPKSTSLQLVTFAYIPTFFGWPQKSYPRESVFQKRFSIPWPSMDVWVILCPYQVKSFYLKFSFFIPIKTFESHLGDIVSQDFTTICKSSFYQKKAKKKLNFSYPWWDSNPQSLN